MARRLEPGFHMSELFGIVAHVAISVLNPFFPLASALAWGA
jgi:hypothetical protein